MTESEREESGARPTSGRAFLKRQSFALPNLAAQLIFWPLMAAGLTLDLWSKRAVFDWLRQEQSNSISIIDGFLRFVWVLNDGAAFGLFSGHRYRLIAVSAIALIASIVIFLSSRNERKLFHVSLGILAAGICGNLYDRVFNGGLVRDFIDVYYGDYHWPAFNVGDIMLCVGVGLMIISILSTGKSSRRCARQHK
jgi:signal peptidase II